MPHIAAVINGTGSFVPQRRLTNADLEKMVETSDEWIVQRTGIRERRIAAAEESTGTLALEAAQRALEAAKLSAEKLDMIIVATLTPETPTPSTACWLHENLRVGHPLAAFDLGAACSGFVYGLATATQFIGNGSCRNILVVGAETLSRVVDYQDRGTCILFGDGAGAAVISAVENSPRGVRAFELGSDGKGGALLNIPAGGSRTPASAESVQNRLHYLKMNGREVYKFAVHQMTTCLQRAMAACQLGPQDVRLVVPHQMNQRIIDSATEKMGFPKEKVFINIDRYGNTSAASVPLALDEAVRQGRCGPGDWIILVAFGAGLTWASATVRL